ncbi:hypothetical protein [Ruminiclostridium cellobioparum]|uniref:Uncharacterized protein n=1 Tax=Ruminiclostridium cellobioparum subsp. termitidis CT1112 TaxID=1195236 RepID=S0FVV4_RUMCE|nr:hypothetical protein [Ruminiclostridium cellobioparum]EMS73309.1 hypothetical protein CTER_0828 [Ruminiclostridium cellobioparum subsp. termitidis CT1112]
MKKLSTKMKIFISLGTLFINFYCFFILANNYNIVYYPTASRAELSQLLDRASLTGTDYAQLLRQTGLGRPAVDDLIRQSGGKAEIIAFQQSYYTRNQLFTEKLNLFTSQETLVINNLDKSDNFGFAPLKNGDILMTKSTQTLFWRHGHCGIVTDAEKGITLESLEPGTISMKQDISKWRYYPTLKVLRLKNADEKVIENIVKYSENSLTGLKYSIFASKYQCGIIPKSANCSQLIWQAFNSYGYNLDSNRGILVTPEDIAKSPLLEIVQIKGFDPEKSW